MKKLLTIITIIWLAMPNAIAQLITEQPGDTSVCPEGVAEFHISVADQVDSVEWQVANLPTGPWAPPMGGVSGINDTILIVSQPNVYEDKYFRAVVWDTLDNMESSDTVILDVYTSPQADINPTDTAICNGQSVTLTAFPANAQYEWSTSGMDTLRTIMVSMMGTYSVTVTDVNSCTGTSSASLIVHPLPTVNITPSMPSFCVGESIALTASLDPDYDYLWSTNETTEQIFVNQQATYSVTVTDTNGCESSTSVTTNTLLNPKAAFVTLPPGLEGDTIDVGQNVFFTDASSTNSGAPITSWVWSFGSSAQPNTASTNMSGEQIPVKYNTAGLKTAILKVTDDNNCMDVDSIEFYVVSDSIPIVTISNNNILCVGDTMKIEVSVEPRDKTNFKVKPMIDIQLIPNANIIPGNIITNTQEEFRQQFCIVFDQSGTYKIIATGYNVHKSTDEVFSGMSDRDVFSGNEVPRIESIMASSPILCEGEFLNLAIKVFPALDGIINFRINNSPQFEPITNGMVMISNIPSMGLDNIFLSVESITLDGSCQNDTINYTMGFDVRLKPTIILDDTYSACLNTIDTVVASGPDIYKWTDENGASLSNQPKVAIPTNALGSFIYYLEGVKNECSSFDSVLIQIVSPPNPQITGDSTACIGEVITFYSESDLENSWTASGGNILGGNFGKSVVVIWNGSGSVQLMQKIGKCVNNDVLIVESSIESSPPYDSIVYLRGGGILLYPNPDLIPNLCYKWYKDGQLLSDNFQGCVVGTNLPDSELERYSVKVYYCDQDTGCAQFITYRSIEKGPIPTGFHLLAVPNPNSGNFSLQYNISGTGNYIQLLFDSSSRVLRKETISLDTHTGIINMSLSNLPTGVYFIKLINTETGEHQVVPVAILY